MGQLGGFLADIEGLLFHGKSVHFQVGLHDFGLLHLDDFLDELLQAEQEGEDDMKKNGTDEATSPESGLPHFSGLSPLEHKAVKGGDACEEE